MCVRHNTYKEKLTSFQMYDDGYKNIVNVDVRLSSFRILDIHDEVPLLNTAVFARGH
jgi:hypothetical protein